MHRDGDRLLQLLIFNEEFLVSASHQLALITSLPFVHTARRSYRLSDSVNNSEIDLFSFAEHVFRSLFNTDPENSATLTTQIGSGNWTDIGRETAVLEGRMPEATYRGPRGATSRIDLCLLNTAATEIFEGFEFEKSDKCTIPNHMQLKVTLRTSSLTARALRSRKPLCFPDYTPLPPADQNILAQDSIQKFIAEFDKCYNANDPDGTWEAWCHMAEDWLIENARIALGDYRDGQGDRFSGRGLCCDPKLVRVQEQRLYSEGGDLVPALVQAAIKIQRILAEIVIKNKPHQPDHVRAETRGLWEKCRRIGQDDFSVNRFRMWFQYEDCPDEQDAEFMIGRLKAYVNKIGAERRHRRMANQLRKRREEIVKDPSRIFKFLKTDFEPPLSIIKKENGAFTGNVQEMDTILRSKWSTIFCKHDDEHPAPEVQPFMEEYGRYLTMVEQQLVPLTVEQVEKTLGKMKDNGAAGLDGWKPGEMKRLPKTILEYLVLFYDVVERTGKWPATLGWAAVTLIPKGEGAEPLEQRPLSVMPVAYRVWAAARVTESMTWQELWIRQGQHGCRPHHGTSDALYRIGLETELAYLNGEKLEGAALDFSKAFDNIPVAITLRVLKELGIHCRVLEPLIDMYARLQRRFKIRGYLGEAFTATNGIMQGDPLSVLLLNAIVCVLSFDIAAKTGDAVANQSYVDDITLTSTVQGQLVVAMSAVEKYVRLTDQKLNVRKTYLFGVNCDSNLRYQGELLPKKDVLKILGLQITCKNQKVQFRHLDNEFENLEATCNRVRGCDLPFWARANLIASLAVGKAAYACELKSMLVSDERKIKVSTTAAIWQKTGRHRNPGVIHTLLTKGHLTDISQALPVTRLLRYAKAVQNDVNLAYDLWNGKDLAERGRRNMGMGPIDALLYACDRLHIRWDTATNFVINGIEYDVTKKEDNGSWAHALREQARAVVWHQVRSDCRRARDEGGVLVDIGEGGGVDRARTLQFYNTINEMGKGALRCIFANGVWTDEIRSKLPENIEKGLTAECKYCDYHATDNLEHIWWECPAWNETRAKTFPGIDNVKEYLNVDAWPRCTKLCGIINLNFNTLSDEFCKIDFRLVHKMFLNIFVERKNLQEQN